MFYEMRPSHLSRENVYLDVVSWYIYLERTDQNYHTSIYNFQRDRLPSNKIIELRRDYGEITEMKSLF